MHNNNLRKYGQLFQEQCTSSYNEKLVADLLLPNMIHDKLVHMVNKNKFSIADHTILELTEFY